MIDPEELKIEIEAGRMGGIKVGTYTGVKVTHIPTGTEAVCKIARSQHVNKMIALEMIETALTHPRAR